MHESLESLTQGLKALVAGDVMLDRQIAGSVERISPVPVVRVEREREALGGAGHVAASLAALGCQVTLAGVVGDDRDGALLRRLLADLDIEDGLIACAEAATITKTRILGGPHQQLLRLDRDGMPGALARGGDALWRAVERDIKYHDVVVIADYDKSTISESLATRIAAACREARVPCIVDSKKPSFEAYRGATLLAPNTMEVQRVIGRKLESDDAVAEAARRLRCALALDYMVITRGAEGMAVASGEQVSHVPARARHVADVTGAGDTVTSVLAACVARGWKVDEAAHLASIAAGLAVSRPGTYAVPLAELDAAYRGRSPKLCDWNQARDAVAAAQQAGRAVAFTNGCFDLLHAGHLASLEQARQLGHFLAVGLNSDISVRLNKGPSRPVISQEHRAALLAGLACVDLVVVFDEERPEALIRHLAPDILVKGNDYAPHEIAGAEFVIGRGGRVVTLPLIAGLSSTNLLRRRREAESVST